MTEEEEEEQEEQLRDVLAALVGDLVIECSGRCRRKRTQHRPTKAMNPTARCLVCNHERCVCHGCVTRSNRRRLR